ncbi:MAG: HEAT repeat domain-containing protein [bacterium]
MLNNHNSGRAIVYLLIYVALFLILVVVLAPLRTTSDERKSYNESSEEKKPAITQYVKPQTINSVGSKTSVEAMGFSKDPQYIPRLIGILKYSSDRNEKLKAINALKKIGGSKSINSILNTMKDFDPKIRISAIKAIRSAGIKHPDAIPQLIDIIEWDNDLEVRKAAIVALEHSVNSTGPYKRRLFAVLINIIKDPYSNLQSDVEWLIREIGDTSIISDVLPLLEENQPSVKKHAANILAEIGDESAIPYLEQVAKSSGGNVRTSAEYAINSIMRRN